MDGAFALTIVGVLVDQANFLIPDTRFGVHFAGIANKSTAAASSKKKKCLKHGFCQDIALKEKSLTDFLVENVEYFRVALGARGLSGVHHFAHEGVLVNTNRF